MNRRPCGCQRETPDGRKIAANGIPEGGKPLSEFPRFNNVAYIDTDGTERFRYYQGCPIPHTDDP